MATLEKSGKPKKVGRPKGSTKSKTKTKTKTTSGSKTKGGNFLGAVGELIAPTGWESFVTTAALVAIDRADAALRRGKEGKKIMKKMSGGAESKKNSFGIVDEIKKILRRIDLLDLYKDINYKIDNFKDTNDNKIREEIHNDLIEKIDIEILKRNKYISIIKNKKNSIQYFKDQGMLNTINIPNSEAIIDNLTLQIKGLEEDKKTIMRIFGKKNNLNRFWNRYDAYKPNLNNY